MTTNITEAEQNPHLYQEEALSIDFRLRDSNKPYYPLLITAWEIIDNSEPGYWRSGMLW